MPKVNDEVNWLGDSGGLPQNINYRMFHVRTETGQTKYNFCSNCLSRNEKPNVLQIHCKKMYENLDYALLKYQKINPFQLISESIFISKLLNGPKAV